MNIGINSRPRNSFYTELGFYSDNNYSSLADSVNHRPVTVRNTTFEISFKKNIRTVKKSLFAAMLNCCRRNLNHSVDTQAYDKQWSKWEKQAEKNNDEHKNRAEAVKRMRECLKEKSSSLELNDLKLTSLPEYLPQHITQLVLSNNRLCKLPRNLPKELTLLSIEKNKLKNLPDNLPRKLEILNAGNNKLAELPSPLPEGLRKLLVQHNELINLPPLPHSLTDLDIESNGLLQLPTLPTTLNYLNARYNKLNRLPLLPNCLTYLQVSSNELAELPELPATLTDLFASYNQLSELPAIPTSIRILELRSNRFTSLPVHIGHIQANATIDFGSNHLRKSLARPLHVVIRDWLGKRADTEKLWTNFESENNAPAFCRFLDKLGRARYGIRHQAYTSQVPDWLDRLAAEPALRAKAFMMAVDASSSCEDRVTLAYNMMQTMTLAHDAENGVFDSRLPSLVHAARQLFRLEQLEKIAHDKVLASDISDEVEVYLGYQYKLRNALKLDTVVDDMAYFNEEAISHLELLLAKTMVKNAEKCCFREWITQWAPWQKMLQRLEPGMWQKASEEKIKGYHHAYSQFREELKSAGLTGDDDGEREIGFRAMKVAEKTMTHSLVALTQQLLSKHGLSNDIPLSN